MGPLEEGHAVDLVRTLGAKRNLALPEKFILCRLGANPGLPLCHRKPDDQRIPTAAANYPDLAALDAVVSYELTHPQGELFKHYNAEFHKYSKLLNDGTTTKQVMFWATKYPDQRIEVEEIAEKIGVAPQEVHESLQKLEELDVIQRASISMFKGPTEPMLKRFITYQYDFEIRKLSSGQSG